MRAAIRPLSAAPRLALAARRAASTVPIPKHEHHSPATLPPPPPPGVEIDPQRAYRIHGDMATGEELELESLGMEEEERRCLRVQRLAEEKETETGE